VYVKIKNLKMQRISPGDFSSAYVLILRTNYKEGHPLPNLKITKVDRAPKFLHAKQFFYAYLPTLLCLSMKPEPKVLFYLAFRPPAHHKISYDRCRRSYLEPVIMNVSNDYVTYVFQVAAHSTGMAAWATNVGNEMVWC
jgi:hypothetical protein